MRCVVTSVFSRIILHFQLGKNGHVADSSPAKRPAPGCYAKHAEIILGFDAAGKMAAPRGNARFGVVVRVFYYLAKRAIVGLASRP